MAESWLPRQDDVHRALTLALATTALGFASYYGYLWLQQRQEQQAQQANVDSEDNATELADAESQLYSAGLLGSGLSETGGADTTTTQATTQVPDTTGLTTLGDSTVTTPGTIGGSTPEKTALSDTSGLLTGGSKTDPAPVAVAVNPAPTIVAVSSLGPWASGLTTGLSG